MNMLPLFKAKAIDTPQIIAAKQTSESDLVSSHSLRKPPCITIQIKAVK